MHRALLSVLALLAPLTCLALDVTTPSGHLDLQLPAGYTPLSREEMQKQFGRSGTLPLAVYGDAGRHCTIAVTWTLVDNGPLKADGLPAFSSQLRDSLNQQIPGIKWLATDMRMLNGKTWMHLDYVSPARDSHIHNATFGTDLGGNLLLVNFSAPNAFFPASAPVFRAVLQTLRTH